LTQRGLAILLTLACGSMPATGRAAMSVGNYLLIESGEAEVDPRYAYVYVSGVLDALTAFNEAMRGAGISLFCPVDDAQPIEIDAFKALLDRAIEQEKALRPDFEQYARAASIGIVGLGVLNEALPCADAAGASRVHQSARTELGPGGPRSPRDAPVIGPSRAPALRSQSPGSPHR
jgi:hypothetical protein